MHRLSCVLLLWFMAGVSSAQSLPRSTPEEQGLGSAALLKFVDALDHDIDGLNSFMLVRHGKVVAEGWWAPYTKDDLHILYSLSKSFTSTAVGLAIAEGKLSLDDPVLKFFPDRAPANPSDNLKAMRVRDLLSMSTGQHDSEIQKLNFVVTEPQTTKFLALEVAHKPGTHFVYNTPATYMCAAIVQQVTGEKLIDYLRPRLFEPLGIVGATWGETAEGVNFGGFGLNVHTEDIAKFGQLYLQRGQWQGTQILPAEWVDVATARQTSNGSNPDSDWEQGYGYQFWRARHGCYRGDGAFGQYCIVMPQQDAVLAITSGVRDMQKVMQIAWDNLLPAMSDSAIPPDAAAHATLVKRTAELEVPKQPPTPNAPVAEMLGVTYTFPANDRQLESLQVQQAGDTLSLIVQAAGQEYRIPCAANEWRRAQVPTLAGLDQREPTTGLGIAATYGWLDKQTLNVKLVRYETPFYELLKLRFAEGKLYFDAEYNVSFGPITLPPLVGESVTK
jgi:CubicO group peptidase (beta-lactamase class C family)